MVRLMQAMLLVHFFSSKGHSTGQRYHGGSNCYRLKFSEQVEKDLVSPKTHGIGWKMAVPDLTASRPRQAIGK